MARSLFPNSSSGVKLANLFLVFCFGLSYVVWLVADKIYDPSGTHEYYWEWPVWAAISVVVIGVAGYVAVIVRNRKRAKAKADSEKLKKV